MTTKRHCKHVKTTHYGTVAVYMLAPGKWEYWDGTTSYVFEHVKTFGPSGNWWTLPNGETARTLEFAVTRTLRGLHYAHGVCNAFKVFE